MSSFGLRLSVSLFTATVLLSACSGGITNAGTIPSTTTPPPTTEALATTTSTTATIITTSTIPATTTTTEPPPLEWNLLAGGDVLMDRTAPAGIDPFVGIEPALSSADVALVNVEMVISDRGSPVPGKMFVFRAPPIAAETIGAAGIDVVTLGNNHSRDYGGDALIDTIELLRAQGVATVGAGANATEAFAPTVLTVGPPEQEISVAVIGASLIVPGGFAATASRSGVANGKDRDRVLANVRVAAEQYDVVVVTLHWGIERDTCPTVSSRDFAAQILEAGATALIGHHPHVLQPVEFADGKVVAFSMGNFAWHPRNSITGDTGVLELSFSGPDLVSVKVHPHILDSNGSPVPISEGFRFDRINEIVGGECEKHDPPPVTYAPPTTVATSTTTVTTTTTTTSG